MSLGNFRQETNINRCANIRSPHPVSSSLRLNSISLRISRREPAAACLTSLKIPPSLTKPNKTQPHISFGFVACPLPSIPRHPTTLVCGIRTLNKGFADSQLLTVSGPAYSELEGQAIFPVSRIFLENPPNCNCEVAFLY
ncbi:hypothetical protein AA313_de0209690 [Arthrobotrys entomopaga]|nr:hypothetical protein AA313_de0209690 [Arthrobotrys entomopaga]